MDVLAVLKVHAHPKAMLCWYFFATGSLFVLQEAIHPHVSSSFTQIFLSSVVSLEHFSTIPHLCSSIDLIVCLSQ